MNSLLYTIPVSRLLRQMGGVMSAVLLVLGVTPRSGAAQTAQPSFAFGPETIVVNTAEEFGDGDGTVSLGDAIRRANSNQNSEFVDVIEFDVPGAAPHTIVLEETTLPEITQPLRIDGATQPGFDGTPVIVIDGANLRGLSTGLTLSKESAGSALRSLSLVNFSGNGISLFSDSNQVLACYIGVDASGQAAGNDGQGIYISGDRNTVGGADAADRNVVSGNGRNGINIYYGSENRVLGSYLGLGPTGTTDMGNGESGIGVDFGSRGNVIGGPASGARNVISGNEGHGILLQGGDGDPIGTVILGNYIGTDAGGESSLPNDGNGVALDRAFATLVGGPDARASNRIAFNGSDGIRIIDPLSAGNALRRNVVFQNAGLGIDLGGDGPTTNDAGDGDTGPNALQNFPEITEARFSSRQNEITVTYRVSSDPQNASYPLTVDFYRADTHDEEGEAYLGTDTYTADDFGGGPDKTVTFAPQASLTAAGALLTTATDNSGNTSEFSAPVALAEPEISVEPSSLDFGSVLVGQESTATFTIENTGGADLEVETLTISGPNASAFSVVSGDGPATIPPGQTRQVEVAFAPLSVGAKTATLAVESNAGAEQVDLSGQGQAPPTAQTDPATDVTENGATLHGMVNPGGPETTVTFEYGLDTSYGSTITAEQSPLTGTADQAVSASIADLEPGTTYHYRVTASNAAGNDAGADRTFTTDAPGLSVTPPELAFGEVEVGTTAQQRVTITNTGTADLEVTDLALSGDDAFQLGTAAPLTLAPGATQDLTVTFTPDRAGSFEATLTLASNAGDADVVLDGAATSEPQPVLSVSPSSLDFGSVPVNETADQTVTATNEGSTALQIIDVSLGGAEAGAFAVVSGGDSGTLAPGQSRSVVVEFAPQSAGAKAATLTVESRAGREQVPLSGDGVSVQVSVEEDPPANTNLGIAVQFSSSDFQPTTRELFYRQTGRTDAQSYQSVPFTEEGDAFVATLPAEAVTLRGVEYYARFSDGQRTLTVPASDPASHPVRVRVAVDQQASPVAPAPRTYRMVSVPLALEDPAIGAVLEDDYGRQDLSRWRLLRWDPEAEQYREFPGIDETVEPGQAFWLTTRGGGAFDVEQGLSVDASAPRVITLRPGWNQIANPFAFPVAWEQVERPASVGGPRPHDGVEYEAPAALLLPWEGYFVEHTGADPVTISIAPVEAVENASEQARAQTASEAGYVMRLRAEVAQRPRLRDTWNVIGFARAAAEGRDPMDYAEPPGIGDHLRLSILQDEKRLDGSFKPLGGGGQWWDLEVSLTVEGKPSLQRVTVTLTAEHGRLPEGYQHYVFDRDAGRALSVERQHFTVEVDEDRPVRHLRLVLGTPAFAEAHSVGAPLEPVAFALEKNVPNPFDGGTTIRYRLAQRCRVVLEVYNVLGQRVDTLVEAEQDAGPHEVKWRGDGLAAGVYFYRLRADAFTASRKMILLR